MEKLPPLEKIPEALSAIADHRIELVTEEKRASVYSSDKRKQYTVTWDGDTYASDDNATYWAGYPGYPVIAVWMKQGFLPLDEAFAQQFAGVPWKQLNTTHKRRYDQALKEVMEERGMDEEAVLKELNRILEELSRLPFTVKRGRKGASE